MFDAKILALVLASEDRDAELLRDGIEQVRSTLAESLLLKRKE